MASTTDLVMNSVDDLSGKNNKTPTAPKTFKEMTLMEKFRYTREVITVEPLVAAYIAASILCTPALQNLEFEKACKVNLAYDEDICDIILSADEIGNLSQHINEIQYAILNMHSWQAPVQSVVPLILVLFLGAFSDKYKMRKPFLIIPLIGELFAVVGCILCVVFMNSWPLEAQGFLQTVIPSFLGGPPMVIMAVFSYVADVSSVEMRTLRVGVVQIVLNIINPACSAVSGILFSLIGYYGMLVIAAVLYSFGIWYGWFCLKEPRAPVTIVKEDMCKDLVNPKLVTDTFDLLMKKAPGNDRLAIVLVLLTLFAFSAVGAGEGSVFFLYTNKVYSWTAVEYSYFSTVNTLVHLIGTTLAVPLFTKVFNLSDMIIILLTFLDKIVANIIFGLASTVLLVYIGCVASLIIGVTGVAIRSLATKIVSENDMGKAQSLFGISEAIAAAVAGPLYNSVIYQYTLGVYPSTFFFVGAIVYVLCCVVICWMYFMQKRRDRRIAQGNGTHEKPIQMEEVYNTHM